MLVYFDCGLQLLYVCIIRLSFCGFELCRWHINCTIGASQGHKLLGMECGSLQSPLELIRKKGMDINQEKQLYQRYEWLGYFMRFRNDAIIILSIICLQLPFELTYAHLYEVIGSDLLK